LSVAATVSAEAAAPGAEMLCGPALPAAMTNSVPYCADSWSFAVTLRGRPVRYMKSKPKVVPNGARAKPEALMRWRASSDRKPNRLIA